MKRLFFILLFCSAIEAAPTQKIKTLYNSLDPLSISQHLALYQLYPDTREGQKALFNALALMSQNLNSKPLSIDHTPDTQLLTQGIIALINKTEEDKIPLLNSDEMQTIEHLASHLANRRLKGFNATSEKDVLELNPDEIDLSRGLFLSQLGDDPNALQQLRSYEALIDLMALQIKARLPRQASAEQIITEINRYIFDEMGFRFPPHSLYAKDIDLYTFLPSVLDSRRGVCLGVSILYLCIAQRLNFPLEAVTPPGHIYVRYREEGKTINIETTARGIHVDDEIYLGVDTKSLQERNLKEVIGCAHMNQAAVYWHREDFQSARQAYDKALPYMPDDLLLRELRAYAHILTDDDAAGRKELENIRGQKPDHRIGSDCLCDDYLDGNVDASGIRCMFMGVDENRISILEKKDKIERLLDQFPKFRSGYFALAVTWLQLHRTKEAFDSLKRYFNLRPNDPTALYYLAMVSLNRLDYNSAWKHLLQVESILKDAEHNPRAITDLRRHLSIRCPE